MASTDPWEIGAQFTKMLYDQRMRERGYQADIDERMYQTGAAQQAATTLFGRQQLADQIDFGQQLQRDDAQRRFTHDENKLINLDYKQATKGRGRAGYVTQPVAAGGGGDRVNGISAQSSFAYLTSRGVPPMVAAGIVGNVAAESGWDPAVFSGTRRGDQGTAFGAGQWRGPRQEHLFEFAHTRGHTQPTVEDQLDFFLEEARSGRDPGATKAFQLASQARTPEEAAQAFMQYYERPADASSLGVRAAAARGVFDGGAAAPPGTDTTAALPSVSPTPDTDVRRYTEPTSVAADQPTEVQPTADEDFYKPARAWDVNDFVANGITSQDLLRVPPTMEVVGTEFYSGAALDLMDPSYKRLLTPLGGYSPEETNQYLVLRPKKGTTDAGGTTIPDQPNAIGQPPVVATPNPGAIEAAPVDLQPVSSGAAAAPPPVNERIVNGVGTEDVSNATPTASTPVGARTRRNKYGELEILVDDEWRSTGG